MSLAPRCGVVGQPYAIDGELVEHVLGELSGCGPETGHIVSSREFGFDRSTTVQDSRMRVHAHRCRPGQPAGGESAITV